MKKLYSKILIQLVLALYTFSFTACQQFDIDSQPEGPLNIQIDALDTYSVLATSPSNVVFNISSNTPWSITTDQQWCKPSPAMSAASSLVSEIVVTIENNPEKKARTATLTIKAENIKEEKVITITQASKEELQIIYFDEPIASAGGTVSFDIVSNKSWEITPSSQFLSVLDKMKGAGNENGEKETVTITVPANSGAKRSGTITVKTIFEEKNFTITQEGITIEPENQEDKNNLLNGMGEEKNIKINSNVEWKVEVPEEFRNWLSAEADGDNLKLTAKYNNLFTERTGHVLLRPKQNIAGFENIPITVSQPRNIKLYANSTESIDPETGYATIHSNSNGFSKYVSNFTFKKGRLIWTFDNINVTSDDGYFYICQEVAGQSYGWIHTIISANSNANFRRLVTQSPFGYQSSSFELADFSTVKTLEISVLDDEKNPDKLVVTMYINGKEVVKQENKGNPYTLEPDKYDAGQLVYFGFDKKASPACSLTLKSFEYIPVDENNQYPTL